MNDSILTEIQNEMNTVDIYCEMCEDFHENNSMCQMNCDDCYGGDFNDFGDNK